LAPADLCTDRIKQESSSGRARGASADYAFQEGYARLQPAHHNIDVRTKMAVFGKRLRGRFRLTLVRIRGGACFKYKRIFIAPDSRENSRENREPC
jgi:hypothetical protein